MSSKSPLTGDVAILIKNRWPPSGRQKLIGICEYLDKHFPYKRPHIARNGGNKHGISFGRMYDAAVTRAVTARTLPTKQRDRVSRGVCALFKLLKRLHLTAVAVQVPVQCNRIGVYTRIDLVCHDQNGTVVLVENKTTSHTFAQHRKIYGRNSATRKSILANGLPNTEYVHHQLQLGCMLTMADTVKKKKTYRGVVIVRCSDKFAVYWARSWTQDRAKYPSVLTT